MYIGLPKEIKEHEFRVALSPAGVKGLTESGHKVFVAEGAGEGSGFSDNSYRDVGAIILKDNSQVYENAELIVKVKEPLPQEYPYLREEHILFAYLHLAGEQQLIPVLQDKKLVAIGYETVLAADGTLPLLAPMSEIAGRMAIILGTQYLIKNNGGKGVLLCGVPGVAPSRVVILGGGIVGINATKVAVGLGAEVVVFDISLPRLRYLDDIFGPRIVTLLPNSHNLEEKLEGADLVIGAVLVPGGKTPVLVTREDIKIMKKKSVIIDVAVDQGGCVETIRPTTHKNPTFEVDGVIHYGVTNMPGAVPHTSTLALTNATYPYVKKIADLGLERALEEDSGLKAGVNISKGKIVHKEVARCANNYA
ncbi:MAG: alanine dehydrogenase [Dethiobacteria bacterium]|jgi:alanine dehydrogenase